MDPISHLLSSISVLCSMLSALCSLLYAITIDEIDETDLSSEALGVGGRDRLDKQYRLDRREELIGGIMKNYKLTAVIWREKEGYVSKCPELGVASVGDNVEEARANLKEAVELYLENAKELGMLKEIKEEFRSEERFTSSLEISIQ